MFSEKLNYIMTLTRTTNTEIANYLNVNQSLISRFRLGSRIPSNNSNYIKVELLRDEKQIKVIPTNPGNTTLKISYMSISGKSKSLSYNISVRKGLSLDIENI